MLPVRLFVANEEALRRLWARFEELRPNLADSFPSDPFAFTCWLCDPATAAFTVWRNDEEAARAEEPIGLFVFNGVVRDDSAWAHIFTWDRAGIHPRELIAAAKMACGTMFKAFNLERISGLTPKTLPAALNFAERVGFKIEGHPRRVISVGGVRQDAWLTGLLRDDFEATLRGTMEVEVTNGD